MTIQDLCDLIIKGKQEEVNAVLAGIDIPIEDVERFKEVLTPEFLQLSVDGAWNALSDPEGTEERLVAEQEINHFLSSFQRAKEQCCRSRAQKWADRYSHKNYTASEAGIYQTQYRNVGVNVDYEFVTKIINALVGTGDSEQ